ncbi:MAG: hypothetical protein P0S93_01510 [Candidatus Neptunochlamydia sp.]|nr:hypothetical protein [Candidatus Neptunochlamydia sp.]
MLANQQAKQQTGPNEQGIVDAFEVTLKIIFWVIDHIPCINTFFLNHYNNTIPDVSTKTFKDRELIQLSAFPCPSYFTAKQIAHCLPKIARDYCALIKRSDEAPEYSLCYSMLGVVSTNRPCKKVLDQRVTLFYQEQVSIHLGIPDPEKRPTLSRDFISSFVRILPSMPLIELYIHGPIASNSDRDKLKTIITTTNTLATLHLEVGEDSATYFTEEARGMLETNHTITVFNLTLTGTKSALTFETDPWENLKDHPRCTLTYTNVKAPDGFIPNHSLTFQ